MNLDLKTEIKARGFISLCVKKDGELVPNKTINRSKNVITDLGAQHLAISDGDRASPGESSVWSHIKVGTGTVERVTSSTDLGQPLPATATTSSIYTTHPSEYLLSDNGDGTSTFSFDYVGAFAIGAIDATISEVGIFDYNVLLAGQLIKDEQGNPTTVTVLPDEELIVTYTIELTVPNAPHVIGTGTALIGGQSVGYTIYAPSYFPNISNSSYSYAWEGGLVRVSSSGALPKRVRLYNSAGQYLVEFAATRSRSVSGASASITQDTAIFSSSLGEITDIKYIGFGSYYAIDMSRAGMVATDAEIAPYAVLVFDSPVTKSSAETLSVKITVTGTVVRL